MSHKEYVPSRPAGAGPRGSMVIVRADETVSTGGVSESSDGDDGATDVGHGGGSTIAGGLAAARALGDAGDGTSGGGGAAAATLAATACSDEIARAASISAAVPAWLP